MKNVVIIGAGRLGKGFMGETFSNAGWNIHFIDKDPAVIENLNKKGEYKVTVFKETETIENVISGYTASLADFTQDSINALVFADLILLTIYPENFDRAISYLSEMFEYRAAKNHKAKLSVLCLTNKNHMIPGILADFDKKLKDDIKEWFKEKAVVRDTIIRRSTDAKSNSSLEVSTTAVLSLLIQKPLNINIDDVEWLELTDNLELLKDLKVFVVNGPHAAAAFIGHYQGFKTINEVDKSKLEKSFIKSVKEEIRQAILTEYSITDEELTCLSRFPDVKDEMVDTVFRVAYDPIRKLGNNDRLVGIAKVCLKNNLPYDNIAMAIAYGYLYEDAADEASIKLQNIIKDAGIVKAINMISGLEENDPITKKVIKYYNQLKK